MGRHRYAFISALLLASSACCCAQNRITHNDGTEAPPSPMQKLVDTTSAVVYALEADGERTVDGIEDHTVTLTLGKVEDQGAFQALCDGDSARLLIYTRNLAISLGLSGTATDVTCRPASQDDEHTLTFHLHDESGKRHLFNMDPVSLSLELVAPEPDTLEAVSEDFDEKKVAALIQARKRAPIQLNSLKTRTSHSTMRLPSGWKPEVLPKAIHSDSAFASFDHEYTFADGKLEFKEKLVIKKDRVESPERPAYDEWVEGLDGALNRADGPRLESSSYRPWSAYEGGTEEQKKAAEWMSKASTATEEKKFAEAEDFLKKAAAADPTHQLLHHHRGELAEAQEKYPDALKEYQDELRSFPETTTELEDIAQLQKKMGRTDDAAATLQTWMAADPNTPWPAIELMELYHGMHRDDLAADAGDRGMLLMHEDAKHSEQLLSDYAHELLLTGQSGKAQEILEKLLDVSTDAMVLNNAAYFLSERGLSLERSEKMMRIALSAYDFDPEAPGDGYLIEESSEQKPPSAIFGKDNESLIFSSWDTLGWILFQEHKVQEAESYLRAAWQNRQDPAIGLHLGTLLESNDKPVEALDIYYLALASVPGKRSGDTDSAPDIAALHKNIAALEQKGHASTIKDPAAALLQLRTIDAGPAEKRRGEEPFRLTLLASKMLGSPADYTAHRTHMSMGELKTPPGFFPVGSHAVVQHAATLKCAANGCTLVLRP